MTKTTTIPTAIVRPCFPYFPSRMLHPPPQHHVQILPPLSPDLHPILPPRQHPIHKPLVPLQQTLPRSPLTHPQQPHLVITNRPLQLQFGLQSALPRARQHADDLPVDLKTVQQVCEIGEIQGGGVLAANVEPDKADSANSAAEDFGEVEGFDCWETGVDGGDGGLQGCGAEGNTVVFGGGGVDGGDGRVVACQGAREVVRGDRGVGGGGLDRFVGAARGGEG